MKTIKEIFESIDNKSAAIKYTEDLHSAIL